MAISLLDEDATIRVADSDLGVDGGDESTVYVLKVVSPQVIKRLRRKNIKKRPTGGQGMQEVLDTDAFGEDLWDYVLVGWEGVLWQGEPITPESVVNGVKAKTLLDGSRKAALLERAGANEVVDPGESFRAPA